MSHENLRWNPGTKQWFCPRCGRTSNRSAIADARVEFGEHECRVPSVEAPTAAPGTETTRLIKKPYKMQLRRERGGCRFVVSDADEDLELNLELLQEIPGLNGVSIGFELLPGVTPKQAKTLVETMNKSIVGLIVLPK